MRLNDRMQFDHVIEVHADGSVTDAPDGVYAPELDAVNDTVSDGWELLTGYTGQYGYNGPIMHDSEFIGGGLERDIMARPGYYVALVATYPADEPDGEDITEGWAVAHRRSPDGKHWHSGHNLPGYMPESDVDCYETWAEAKQGMIDTLLRHADNTGSWAEPHDCDDIPCPAYGDSCPEQRASSLDATAQALNLENGPEWGDITAGQSYWINLVSNKDCDQENE